MNDKAGARGMRRLTPRELRKLPAVLTMKSLRKMGYAWPSQVMARMAAAGLVDRMGRGVFHNPLGGPWDIYEAIRACIPVPVIGGPTVLHDAGVITQIPQNVFVISVGERTAPSINGVEVHFRAARWLDRMSANGALRLPGEKENPFPLMSLTPESAWRDMQEHGETAGLNEDDLDWEAIGIGGRAPSMKSGS